MDLDNITDIEVLKKELKKHMVKIKVPIECDNRFNLNGQEVPRLFRRGRMSRIVMWKY